MARMISKEFRLELEAALSQAAFGHGYLHYGYWDGAEYEPSLCALGQAQEAYFERLVATIPEGTRSILDVGSGTGAVAAGLLRRGFAVDCVCPSARLNAVARKKLPASTRIFECTFETLAIEATYDLLLFAESFHYLDAKKALSRIDAHAERHAIIFDYFPKADAEDRRISHRQFRSLLSNEFRGRFAVVKDEDLTDRIAPTLKLVDEIRNEQARPFVLEALAEFRRNHPFYGWVLSLPLRRIGAKFEKTSRRYERFLARYEYRLILLARATAG